MRQSIEALLAVVLAALLASFGHSTVSAQSPSTLDVASVRGETGQVAVVPVKANLEGVGGWTWSLTTVRPG